MATNVRVVLRFRPPSSNEIAIASQRAVAVNDNSVAITAPEIADSDGQKSFHFDRCFDSTAAQSTVFDETAAPYIQQIFNGYNTTIFAYGQTGSGKTHTMMGGSDAASQGIIPRLVTSIFKAIENADEALEFTVKLSYIEIYNERIRDLLTTTSGSDNLKIRDGPRGIYIEGVTECYVASHNDVLSMMAAGSANRAVSSTNMNEQSSRSHSVFMLTLGQLDRNTGSKKGAKLTLVDLAGSEKVLKTGAIGSTLKEAQHINKSLSALGNVINSLTTNSAHVPYRDSKLTRLLSDSLGGNSCTCLIITASPMAYNVEETLSTLRFGTRAKLIKNKPKVNQEKSVAEYKRMLAVSDEQSRLQREIIEALENDVNVLKGFITNKGLTIPVLSGMSGSGISVTLKQLTASGGTDANTDTDSEDAEAEVIDAGKAEEEHKEYVPPQSQSQTIIVPAQTHSRRGSQSSDLASLPARLAAMSQQLSQLQSEKSQLLDQISDKDLELEEATEIFNTEKEIVVLQVKDLLSSIELERQQRSHLEIQARETEILKKKFELKEREHSITVGELKEEKRQLGMKITEVLGELEAVKTQMVQQQALLANANNLKPKDDLQLTNTAPAMIRPMTASATAEPSTPPPAQSQSQSMTVPSALHASPLSAPTAMTKPLMKKTRLSLMKSKTLKKGDLQRAVAVESLSMSLESMKDDETKISTLTEALTLKVDQYIKLKEAFCNSTDHIAMLEMALSESNKKIQELNANARRIKELEEKLSNAEQLCQRLLNIEQQRKSASNHGSQNVSAGNSKRASLNNIQSPTIVRPSGNTGGMTMSRPHHQHQPSQPHLQSHIVVPLHSKRAAGNKVRGTSLASLDEFF